MCLHCTATHVPASHPALGQHPSQVLEDGRARGCVGGGVPCIAPLHSALRSTHALDDCSTRALHPVLAHPHTIAVHVHDAHLGPRTAPLEDGHAFGSVPCRTALLEDGHARGCRGRDGAMHCPPAHPPARHTSQMAACTHARLLHVIRCETGFRGRAPPSHTHDA